jgi:hypothetical protein
MNDHRPHKRRPPPCDPYLCLRIILSACGDLALDATGDALDTLDKTGSNGSISASASCAWPSSGSSIISSSALPMNDDET